MDNTPEQAVNAGAEPPVPAPVASPDPVAPPALVAPPAPTEPPSAAEAATAVQAPTLSPAPTATPAPIPVQAAPAQPEGRLRGWFGRGARAGALAALVVIVAGAFFTIGWFTSTRGDDRDRVLKVQQQMGMKMRGSGGVPGRGGLQRPGGQSYRYNGQGMMVPQQGQGMMAPQGQDGAQQYLPQGQVLPQSK